MSYLLDANVFIQAKNLHYGFDFCPAFWDWLVQNNINGQVFSIDKVRLGRSRRFTYTVITTFHNSNVEETGLAWLEAIGWRIADAPNVAPVNFLAAPCYALLTKWISEEIRVRNLKMSLPNTSNQQMEVTQ